MATAYITHPICLKHEMEKGHPETPARMVAITSGLIDAGLFQQMEHFQAPAASRAQLQRVHEADYIKSIERATPAEGLVVLDSDTSLNAYSYEAALHAAGAVVLGVDLVLGGKVDNAFCNIRPGGHHVNSWRASGFCLFNNVAIGAIHALEQHNLKRVAIADFDVHHGDGTEDIFKRDPRVMLLSTFQYPFFPFRGKNTRIEHIINSPLANGAGSAEFRSAVINRWLPALEKFQPELILISAGFDAHRDDGMSGINLTEEDYAWVTTKLLKFAKGRAVSALEGGYELGSLARSAIEHVRVLCDYEAV